jgi:hypothetical protein
MIRIYLVIWVHHGIIQEPFIFKNLKTAEQKLLEVKRNQFNIDYDEIEIFEKEILQTI